MVSPRLVLSALLGVLMMGCSSEPLVTPIGQFKEAFSPVDIASSSLNDAKACCDSWQQLPYKDLVIGKSYAVLGADSPVFPFSDGKSYVAAYRLPSHSGDIRITAAAQIDKTVFYPRIALLDSNFNVTRVIGDDLFEYKPAQLLLLDRIEAIFTVDRSQINNPNNETYMVIYTPAEKLGSGTKVLHPAKAFARAHSTVEPDVADPVIPHSAWGVVELDLEDISSFSGKVNNFVPEYADKMAMANGGTYVDVNQKPDPAVNKLSVAPRSSAVTTAVVAVSAAQLSGQASANGPASSAAMLTETEQMYNQMILQAVQAGDISKAMTLAAEAERAGSRSAKDTFIQAVKQTQH